MLSEPARYIPQLRTQRLLLRALHSGDAADVFAYAKDPEVARHTLWEPHQTLHDTYAFLDFVSEQHRGGLTFVWGIVHLAEARVIGTIGLVNYAPQHLRAEIGFAIGRRYWRQGYTTEAVHAVLNFAFHDLVLNRVEAYCKVENVASARVMEKNGMRFEGVTREREYIKGRYEDLNLYAILRSDFDGAELSRT